MVIAIIAGGQGTRLWPLSQPEMPKHLLSLVNDKSLLQNTYDRVSGLTKNIFIITEQSHAQHIKQHLPNVPEDQILIEPARRGTASCVLLMLAELSNRGLEQEDMVFLHADHHIDDSSTFQETIEVAIKSGQMHSAITLIGLIPDYPATGFGYIKLGSEANSINGHPVHHVDAFVEKPSLQVARQYVRSKQYLWNLGLFAAPYHVFVTAIKHTAPEMYKQYLSLKNSKSKSGFKKAYLALTNQAIDTALIEKLQDLYVVPGSFDWTDIGSFRDLHELLKNGESNVAKGDVKQLDCRETLVLAHGKPVITIGLDNVVVIDSPNGLLVCHKDSTQRIKEAIE